MNGEKYKLAIIMTCYNRKVITLSCLEAVLKQILPDDLCFQVYLVDDGSTDGTGEAVRRSFPEVIVLAGDGNLFWNRGMNLAFSKAMERDYDYYLWLNDDTLLYPDCLSNLFSTARQLSENVNSKVIVVGSICDPNTGTLNYGGLVKDSRWHRLKFRLLEPGDKPLPCDTMNGNCVLLTRDVVQVTGNLDPSFRHSIGDTDYGLRSVKNGCSIWIAPGYTGTCHANKGIIYYQKLSFREFFKKLNHPKGLPFNEWKIYTQRHCGVFWPVYWIRPYIRLFVISVRSTIGI